MNESLKKHCANSLLLLATIFIAGCGGSGETQTGQTASSTTSSTTTAVDTTSEMRRGAVSLKPPLLSFNDTGLSVSDGVTRNGLWSVANDGYSWEFSLDLGKTWVQGVGASFEVQGDGSKMIWVRSKDDFGNTSEIVMVACVLDTLAPSVVAVSPVTVGITRTLQLSGLEAGARWEYSLDEQKTWLAGSGVGLGVLGNGLARLWLRQIDIAGNPSMSSPIDLELPQNDAWHEASGNPLQPSVLSVAGLQTILIHGSVIRNDADYLRWDIPTGYSLKSVRLVQYVSDDSVAFYAIQRSSVFDAGFDVSRMLVYGHMGPLDLGRNVVSSVPNDLLGSGPMTLWFQQTGSLPTQYSIEVTLQPQ